MDLVFKTATFNYEIASKWMTDRRALSFQLSSAYVILLFLGKRYMQDRAPLAVNKYLVAWNLFLAVFSIIGAISLTPEFVETIQTVGFKNSYCDARGYFEGENGYWVFLFMLSKVIELGDSFFLVVRKRPLIFLHWYHHATVLTYCWISYPAEMACVRWGAWMNYTVHAFMYTYYLLRSLHVRVPGWVAQSITSMQILQFIIGTYVTWDFLFRNISGECAGNRNAAVMQVLLYTSYLALFCHFFYKTYIKKTKKA